MARRPKKPPAENYGTRKAAFLARQEGEDAVADIAFIAEDVRARTGQARAWDVVGGDTRILWALAMNAAAAVIGLTADEYIAKAREQGRKSQADAVKGKRT